MMDICTLLSNLAKAASAPQAHKYLASLPGFPSSTISSPKEAAAPMPFAPATWCPLSLLPSSLCPRGCHLILSGAQRHLSTSLGSQRVPNTQDKCDVGGCSEVLKITQHAWTPSVKSTFLVLDRIHEAEWTESWKAVLYLEMVLEFLY